VPDYDFDMITIGAGSGGVASSRRAASYGARVAICEDSRVGGTCVIRGCVPKKLLVYGSHFREEFEDAAGFGWTVPEPRLDWAALIAAKNREIDRLNAVYIRMLRDAGVQLIEGRGKVVDPHTVEIGNRSYTARHILVAVGARPLVPEIHGIEHGITSDEALELTELPRRIVIIGGGYIGVEFAGIFNAAGVVVTMCIRGDTVLRGFDEDIRSALSNEMRKKGIDIRSETIVEDIEKRADALSVMTRAGEMIDADVVLAATGRVPNTRHLGLEAAGVAVDKDGAVEVDEMSRTAVPSIFAVGDCTNRLNLTPVAIAEGRAVAETLFNNRPTAIKHTGVPSAVFSQPPAASVGLSEIEARIEYKEIDVYVANFRPMKHTLSGRDERVMMKLVVDRASERVIGCHIVGMDAPEIIQGVAIAMKCGATKTQFDMTVGLHPTLAEELVTMRDKRP
jgi:glutathione reductase (NADPH)